MTIRNVLFICTGNSGGSLIAEALVTVLGKGKFKGFSAGTRAAGLINPYALEQIRKIGYPLENLRSKSVNEFASLNAPQIDYVITVCDYAAAELCPVWTGNPLSGHWRVERALAMAGSHEEKRASFEKLFNQLHARVEAFVRLPHQSTDRHALQQATKSIDDMLA
ncbi:arsenate reductase ArsC [Noviherbaspirillum massiliense]|uniref:arsenate reductase ArsC n=1 Tax=Noviherbaspirillum massiliense TaxID=1465823 RepID=UPI0005599DFB|nr:arsenate reductase ArsC [Noviherbaspirillum massiliense]